MARRRSLNKCFLVFLCVIIVSLTLIELAYGQQQQQQQKSLSTKQKQTSTTTKRPSSSNNMVTINTITAKNLTGSSSSSSTSDPPPVPESESPIYINTRKVNIFATIAVIIIGLIGNGLAVFVFAQKRFRMHSSSIYLLCLAISDGLFLLMHFFEDTLRTYIDVYLYTKVTKQSELDEYSFLRAFNITDRFQLSCRLVNYFRYFLRFISAYIIIVFTIQRTIAIHSPLFQARYESKRIAWLIVILVTAIGLVFNLWVPFMFSPSETEIRDNSTVKIIYCDIEKQYSSLYFVLTNFYIVVIMLIPITVIFFCNTLIVLSIIRAGKNRETLSNANIQHNNMQQAANSRRPSAGNSSLNNKNSTTTTSATKICNGINNTNNNKNNNKLLKSNLKPGTANNNGSCNNQQQIATMEQASVSFAFGNECEETPLRKSSGQYLSGETTSAASASNNGINAAESTSTRLASNRRDLYLNRPSIKTNGSSTSSSKIKESKVTRMLIIMSLSYAILNLPYFISWCLFFFRSAFMKTSDKQRYYFFAAINLSEIFYVLNYGIHFFIYCASGQRFRSQLKHAFKFK